MGLTDKHLAYGDDIPQTQTEKDYYWKINRQQSCDDCISRQAVIKLLSYDWANRPAHKAVESIRNLPSVAPKEKTGKWIEDANKIDAQFGRHTYIYVQSVVNMPNILLVVRKFGGIELNLISVLIVEQRWR